MPPLLIRPMQMSDLDGVIALENISFPQPWPRSLYQQELKHGRFSSYFVVVPRGESFKNGGAGENRIAGGRAGNGKSHGVQPALLAHGGYWLMDGEIHIVTIATDPGHRGQGIGRWLLLYMLSQAREAGGHTATLEVRPSNKPALTLYKNLGFRLIGQRKRYYPDGEDALILEIGDLDIAYQWQPLARIFRALTERLGSISSSKPD